MYKLPILYERSSSINNWELCQQQYFLTYILGYRQKTNHKATLGTISHRILECLAIAKKNLQENNNRLIDKELDIDILIDDNWLKPTKLSQIEIDRINSTRINKDIYQWDCKIYNEITRYGVEFVEYIIEKCYNFYSKNSTDIFPKVDFKNVTNWVWITLDYQHSQFDPRKKYIVDTETEFNIEIKEDWAKYKYDYMGQNLEGYLKLKGSIDLTSKVDDDTLEILDFKTGQRIDWKSGKIKTYKDLHEDNQLLTYFYAAKQLYPDKNIIISIFFIRSGGPYTICFHEEDLQKSLKIFKRTFLEVQKCKLPTLLDPLQKNFMCSKVCDYFKTNINGQNTCKFINNEIQKYGIEYVINTYTNPDFHPDFYQSPGQK